MQEAPYSINLVELSEGTKGTTGFMEAIDADRRGMALSMVLAETEPEMLNLHAREDMVLCGITER